MNRRRLDHERFNPAALKNVRSKARRHVFVAMFVSVSPSILGQAQRFMNNRGDDRDSYDRRRDDERRGQQALRDRDGDRRDYDRDRSRDDRYRQPDSGYGRR
jgi:hypothetical protein